MRTMRAMRRSITVVDMAVDDSPRVRSEALPLAIILDRELILSVQSAVVCSTGRVRKCSQLVDHRRVIGGRTLLDPDECRGYHCRRIISYCIHTRTLIRESDIDLSQHLSDWRMHSRKEDRAAAAASGNRFSAGVRGNFRKNGRDRA
jgi:hypothetical protein